MTRRRPATDEGMTLIEMVIAMLIMSIAVVTIVGALATMIELTAEHRGHAVIEAGTRSFGEAAQEQAKFTTKLTAGVTSGATTLPVADTSLLPRVDGTNTYVSVDREVMRVTNISASALTVVRDVNGDAPAAHLSSAAVVPVLRCPSATQLTPASGTYALVTGVAPSITSVEYWNASTGTFQDRASCLTNYDDTCALIDDVALPECGYGYYRAAVTVSTTAADTRLRTITTATRILLRTGSS